MKDEQDNQKRMQNIVDSMLRQVRESNDQAPEGVELQLLKFFLYPESDISHDLLVNLLRNYSKFDALVQILLDVDESQLAVDDKFKLTLIKYFLEEDFTLSTEKIYELVDMYAPELVEKKKFVGRVEILDREIASRIDATMLQNLCFAIGLVASRSLVEDPEFDGLLKNWPEMRKIQIDRSWKVWEKLVRASYPWKLLVAREKKKAMVPDESGEDRVLGVIALDSEPRKLTYVPMNMLEAYFGEDVIEEIPVKFNILQDLAKEITIKFFSVNVEVEMKLFHVDVDHRGLLVGRRLHHAALEEAFTSGVEKVHVLSPVSKNLMRFFVNRGYEVLGLSFVDVKGEPVNFILMEFTRESWEATRDEEKQFLDRS